MVDHFFNFGLGLNSYIKNGKEELLYSLYFYFKHPMGEINETKVYNKEDLISLMEILKNCKEKDFYYMNMVYGKIPIPVRDLPKIVDETHKFILQYDLTQEDLSKFRKFIESTNGAKAN